MFEGGLGGDRRRLLLGGLLSGAATVLAMAVGFAVVAAVLMLREGLIVGRLWTRMFALAVMYLLPQFVVGLWVGRRYGLSIGPPIAAGLAPVVVLVLALGAFGGPLGTPFRSPALTAGAIVVWSAVCAAGMLVGDAVVLGVSD